MILNSIKMLFRLETNILLLIKEKLVPHETIRNKNKFVLNKPLFHKLLTCKGFDEHDQHNIMR